MTARPIRRSQEERSRTTRKILIDSAIDCISTMGYARATTQEIAKHARVSRGALQHHFGSRGDLLAAVIDEVIEELNFNIEVADLKDKDIATRFDGLVQNFRRVFEGKLFLAALNIWLGTAQDPELKQQMQHRLSIQQQRLNQLWAELFHDAALESHQLVQLRRMVMALLRGYSINQLFGNPTLSWEDDKQLILPFLTSLLESGVKGETRSG